MIKKFLSLKDIDCYFLSYNLSNYVWNIVIQWNYFEKNSLGSQFARAIDSISSNIAEGFGRYNKKDKVKFYRYSMGSLYECLDWNQKSMKRDLITKEDYNFIFENLQKIKPEIYSLINYTNLKLKF
ncbi:MAG: four helix bundle protein [Candidatus Magasanikbacteria bacterium CG_4_10_14_0_8_um_filter_32_14]|uniref:Four helix bundle protein n=2 Tax=Candidatus Magasanikiibacteriota TaxID=1752731 RepID=A0A2M7R8M3_9BACT|nr:MAG: hypothetical protein AUJ23_01095 [Candidatus Magasanikbacteria bacterium CG1_02_32_51]PIY93105.1 MAG: four helix bundle protein [Candidatus Magasanikbacteria bacterium CG_4_10_14_0_8_um_filter_32_14]